MQNPSANPETITITLANAKGKFYTFSVTFVSHSRYTLDMVGTIIHNLYQNGDSYQGYKVSMAVQLNAGPIVVERLMYWNASGTQGKRCDWVQQIFLIANLGHQLISEETTANPGSDTLILCNGRFIFGDALLSLY
jgi:hypothetical protein